MATFSEYIAQARKNLEFLSKINHSCNSHWDWQVTVVFYVAVHLANAHLRDKNGETFNTHVGTLNALNCYKPNSSTKLSEANYLAYRKLYNLSRMARYLCSNADKPDNLKAYHTFSVHFEKAIKNLEKLLDFMDTDYKQKFDPINLNLIEIKGKNNLKFFRYQRSEVA